MTRPADCSYLESGTPELQQSQARRNCRNLESGTPKLQQSQPHRNCSNLESGTPELQKSQAHWNCRNFKHTGTAVNHTGTAAISSQAHRNCSNFHHTGTAEISGTPKLQQSQARRNCSNLKHTETTAISGTPKLQQSQARRNCSGDVVEQCIYTRHQPVNGVHTRGQTNLHSQRAPVLMMGILQAGYLRVTVYEQGTRGRGGGGAVSVASGRVCLMFRQSVSTHNCLSLPCAVSDRDSITHGASC